MVGGNLALITPIPSAAMPESRISNSTTTPASPFPPTTSRSFTQTHQIAIIEPRACDCIYFTDQDRVLRHAVPAPCVAGGNHPLRPRRRRVYESSSGRKINRRRFYQHCMEGFRECSIDIRSHNLRALSLRRRER